MKYSIALAAATAVSMSAGQILFKIGSERFSTASPYAALHSLFTNPWIITGVLLYGCTIVMWVYLLKHIPLSVCYPITALAYIIVPIASHMLFGEELNSGTLIGSVLIFAGISITALSWHEVL